LQLGQNYIAHPLTTRNAVALREFGYSVSLLSKINS
jgi:hypothetical protein